MAINWVGNHTGRKNTQLNLSEVSWLFLWKDSSHPYGNILFKRVFILTTSFAKVNRSECDHLLLILTNGGQGTVINRQRPIAVKAKSSTCFALRGERFASSSRLIGLSLLGYKDGTRTIEMILVSTVLKGTAVYWNDRLKVNILYMWERFVNEVNTHAQYHKWLRCESWIVSDVSFALPTFIFISSYSLRLSYDMKN